MTIRGVLRHSLAPFARSVSLITCRCSSRRGVGNACFRRCILTLRGVWSRLQLVDVAADVAEQPRLCSHAQARGRLSCLWSRDRICHSMFTYSLFAHCRHHVDAVADLSNSRGASSCVYGAAVLAILVAGDRGLEDCFGASSAVTNSLLLAARVLPEVFSPRSSRIRAYPFAAAFLVALLVSAAYRSPVSISVAQAVSFWLAVHCLLRLFPAIISLHPEREYAAVDYAGHVYGALYAGLCGACHLLLNRRACPSAQAWVALVVLTLSTLPREALLYRSD